MKRLLLIGLLLTGNAFAADDPKVQIEFLQTALVEVQAQRNAALDQLASLKAQAAVQITALQKRIEELTPKAEVKK